MALGPGSIAFVGLNTDGNDNLAFVALEAIPSGTVIYFQDNEWNGLAIGSGGAFNTGESTWSWTATSEVAAGSIITIDNIGTGTIGSNTGTAAFISTANRGLNNSDEVIYAFIGNSDTDPTAFLTAATNGNFAAHGSIANTGLAAGTNAIEFNNADESSPSTAAATTRQASRPTPRSSTIRPTGFPKTQAATSRTMAPRRTYRFRPRRLRPAAATPRHPRSARRVPADDAGNVAANANIVLNFDEAVQKGTGNILIKLVADDSIVQTIDVASADVSVSGSTVTINPPADLAPGTAYLRDGPDRGIRGPRRQRFRRDRRSRGAELHHGWRRQRRRRHHHPRRSGFAAGSGGRRAHRLQRAAYEPASAPTTAATAQAVPSRCSFDPTTDRAFVTNAAGDRIDIVDLSNPTQPGKSRRSTLGALTGYGEVNSVAVKNGIVAVAIQNSDATQSGVVRFYDADGNFIKELTVGVLPDQLTFSPDGSKLLVANEAEPSSATANAAGTISIIDMSGGAAAATVVNTIGFGSLDGHEAQLESLGLSLLARARPVRSRSMRRSSRRRRTSSRNTSPCRRTARAPM